jgi:hypothetical protein
MSFLSLLIFKLFHIYGLLNLIIKEFNKNHDLIFNIFRMILISNLELLILMINQEKESVSFEKFSYYFSQMMMNIVMNIFYHQFLIKNLMKK